MQQMLSLEVAEHALREHIARTGVDLAPYSVILSRGSLPSRNNDFIDMGIVRDEMRIRAGRMVTLNRFFRLQQWLTAEAFITVRWPQHQSYTVSYDMLSGLDFDGLRAVAPGRRRR